ncbi:MAG: response regulator [candidate division Zixibacteria bacterium]|nr:response regulator [candidate division Zixibacteria bacterium]
MSDTFENSSSRPAESASGSRSHNSAESSPGTRTSRVRLYPMSQGTIRKKRLPAADSASDPASRILILAPFGNDAGEIRRMLSQAGIDSERCETGTNLCTEIDRGAAAALITREALTSQLQRAISATLTRQPYWSEFPIVVLGSSGSTQRQNWEALQGLEGTAHLVLIQRPVTVTTLLTVVRTALNARQKQYQIRDEIAAREAVERALRESEAKYRSIFEHIDEGFNLFEVLKDERGNVVDGMFLEVNPAYEQQTGLEAEHVVGRRLTEIFPRFERVWWEAIKSVVETGEPIRVESFSEDTRRYYEVSCFAFAPERICGLFRDITERKQSEQMLRDMNKTLEDKVAERTEVAERRAGDLSRMAAELSRAEQTERKRLGKILHDDLQQILLASIWRLHALECTNSAQERGKDDVEKLLNDCLQSSRSLSHELSPPVLELGTLDEIFRWVGDWARDKYGLDVTIDCSDEPANMAQHIRTFLYEAVRELLVNIVKHSGQFRAAVTVRHIDATLQVTVEDYGSGFDPRHVEKHLDNPQTFGLYRIRERLMAMQGRLDVARNASGGAQIQLVVPLSGADESHDDVLRIELSEDDETGRQIDTTGKRIQVLVVDDHTVVRQGLVQLLRKHSQFVVVGEAADGEQAVEAASRLRPDVVIMDVSMPNMNGIEATRIIKRDHPEMVVIGLSLHDKGAVAQSMANAGATAYVRKDAPADELLDTIRLACETGE